MKNATRFLALALVLILVLGLAAPAFATEYDYGYFDPTCELPYTITVTVPAYDETLAESDPLHNQNYVNCYGAAGYTATITTVQGVGFSNGEEGFVFKVSGSEYSFTLTATDNALCQITFTNYLNYDVEMTVVITGPDSGDGEPSGEWDDPAALEMGTNTVDIEYHDMYSGYNGYYYNWTNDTGKDGYVQISVSSTTGWMYYTANKTTSVYGEYHWSDDDPVVSSETIAVANGDTIEVWVKTYDPEDAWSTPAGTVTVEAAFYPAITMGANTTNLSAGDFDGETFGYIAEKDGHIAASLDSFLSDGQQVSPMIAQLNIAVTNTATGEAVGCSFNGYDPGAVAVSEGDFITVQVYGSFMYSHEVNYTLTLSDHGWDTEGTYVDPTCTENGYTSYTCEACGAVKKEIDENAAALGHDYKNGVCTRCDAEDPDYVAVMRIAGADRFETAFKAADEMKETLGLDKFHTVILTYGYNFADALSGSYLACVKSAPILLTHTNDEKNAETVAYVKANLIEGGTVYILGGPKAVPESVETMLEDYNVIRLSGKDRYETNLRILEEATVVDGQTILVCTGNEFADSLSASATCQPILLVNKVLTDDQKAFLSELNTPFCIVGGVKAVSAELEAELANYGNVERLSGASRYETSVLVAERYFPASQSAVLAYGRNFPDGLCGGSLAYAIGAPLILTQTGSETEAVAYTTERGITSGIVLGGEKLISDESVRTIFQMTETDVIGTK